MIIDGIDFIGPPPRKVRGLSWGALMFSPLWQFRNGFWITTVFYLVCMHYFWPLALCLNFLFFFFGARWSWSRGQRWESYAYFTASKFEWDFAGIVALIVVSLIAIIENVADRLS